MNSLFVYEDERIKRDFVNSITRVMNMDIANQNKTLEAADKQLRSISVLENMTDITKLSKSMREAITLRKKYPESSLNELSDYSEELFNKTISKSALNHRYRSINDLADQIMENLNE
jgi:DNA-binding protein WhiA